MSYSQIVRLALTLGLDALRHSPLTNQVGEAIKRGDMRIIPQD